MKLLTLLSLPVLLFIAYTDFKTRKISLIALLVFTLLSIGRIWYSNAPGTIITLVLLNLLLFAIICGMVGIYSILRKKSLSRLAGLGDAVFLVIAALNFSPFWYLFFVAGSSLIGIALFWFYFRNRTKIQTLPFAGIMAGILTITILLEQVHVMNCYNDSVFFQIIG